MAKVARRDGKAFDRATRLHRAKELPKEELNREVERHLTRKETGTLGTTPKLKRQEFLDQIRRSAWRFPAQDVHGYVGSGLLPRAVGGDTDFEGNLITLCARCHKRVHLQLLE